MRIKLIAAPLVAGAMLAPAALSTPAAHAAVPAVSTVSSNTSDAHALLGDVIDRIDSLTNDLKDAKASMSPKEVIDTISDLLKQAKALKAQLEKVIKGVTLLVKSIPARVELFLAMCDTTHTATLTIQDKVQNAHTVVFDEIAHAINVLISLDSTPAQLTDEVAALNKALATAQAMPDLKPNDVATKFVRAKLGRLMSQVRFDRNTCVTKYKDHDTVRLLNRAIDRAGLVRGNAWVRVSEVDQAMKDLEAAYQDALKAPNKENAPASPSVCMPAANAPVTFA
ncbi:CAMP factor family pore-forming toxin [Cutibacterium equinum]|uniref:cAMP factor family pore-forming toxin n=1 Tax=Cutibacterium equinum TaxID=3016342 RepID=A0ABY7R1Z9_9ACTN|nr:CAMP factor family pore-forming toxin [Cutibacterium equinum]WCC80884.1 CAMP factor family pore-forming toxin [Cutibacterium equinum]